MKRGSSASIHSGSHLSSTLAISSCHQRSRPGVQSHLILSPTRFTTITFSMEGQSFRAVSASFFWGTALAPRKVPSQTTRIFAFGILDPDGQRVGAEPAENDGMDGADAGAGQHGDPGLGDHRHVDADAVALLDPVGLQYIGELADFPVQLAVGDGPLLARLVPDPLDRHLVAPLFQLPVEAVVGDVQLGALEILHIDRPLADVEIEILDLVPLLEEGQILIGLLGPPGRRIGQELRVELLVLLPAFDVGDFANPLMYRINLFQLYLFLFSHVDLPFFAE